VKLFVKKCVQTIPKSVMDRVRGDALKARASDMGEGFMSAKLLGEPLRPRSPAPLHNNGDKSPGYGWQLSVPAQKAIEEIEANARAAEQRSGSLTLR
jgi:hypothetical protein